jgi:hypothetical protein
MLWEMNAARDKSGKTLEFKYLSLNVFWTFSKKVKNISQKFWLPSVYSVDEGMISNPESHILGRALRVQDLQNFETGRELL